MCLLIAQDPPVARCDGARLRSSGSGGRGRRVTSEVKEPEQHGEFKLGLMLCDPDSKKQNRRNFPWLLMPVRIKSTLLSRRGFFHPLPPALRSCHAPSLTPSHLWLPSLPLFSQCIPYHMPFLVHGTLYPPLAGSLQPAWSSASAWGLPPRRESIPRLRLGPLIPTHPCLTSVPVTFGAGAGLAPESAPGSSARFAF